MDEDNTKQLGKVIKIDESEVQKHVSEIVRVRSGTEKGKLWKKRRGLAKDFWTD